MKKNKKQRANEVANYYGFGLIESPVIKKGDINKIETLLQDETSHHRNRFADLSEKNVAVLQLYEEKNMANLPQPVMLCFENRPNGKYFSLEILGCAKAISEATIIQTALAILREQGFNDLYVDINSLGDRESANRFFREFGNFYRKHRDEKHPTLIDGAPKSVAFLSELAKNHFTEVLEYLEALDIPYRINNSLLDVHQLVTHTIFEIKNLKAENGDDNVLAFGFRYNAVARKIGMKKEIPAIGITITVKKTASKKSSTGKVKKPKVFFAQIGTEAKLKSLKIIEMLRLARIEICQTLSKDKMSSQIAVAENLKVPYLIIMGQKEAMENAVIVRNMLNRSQAVVPIPKLADYLKHLKG